MGSAGRRASSAILILLVTLEVVGCGGSSKPLNPARIALTPAVSSVNLGDTVQLTATAFDFRNNPLPATLTFQSTNPKVATVSTGGTVCAGRWNAAFVKCTPGNSGVAKVTANAGTFATSTPVTVFVHSVATNIQVSAINPGTGPNGCVTKGITENFQAAVFSDGTDITSTVGPVTWGVTDSTVATVKTAKLPLNQVQITAAGPGITSLFASVSGVNSPTVPFETCRVRSVSVTGPNSASSITVAKGGRATVTATAVDSAGAAISAPVSWLTSNPAAATVTGGSVTGVNAGTAAISASCTPPTCNTNLPPIYSSDVVTTTVTGGSTGTILVSSTDCSSTPACHVSMVPVPFHQNTPGTAVALPANPNSFLENPAGTQGFFGSDAGLIVLNLTNNSAQLASSVHGKVLAVAPNGSSALVSNTTGFNVVDIVNPTNGASQTLPISGVTAASFSPDSLKAFTVGGTSGAAALYVFSSSEPVLTVPLPALANDVGFMGTGTFGFVAESSSPSLLPFATCDNSNPLGPGNGIPITGTATQIAPTPNGAAMVAVASPGINVIPVTTNATACPPSFTPPGTSPAPPVVFQDFGQGAFNATQLLISPDGVHAYLISDLPKILAFNIQTGTVESPSPLTDGVTALQGALTTDGALLFVGTSDGTVHVLDTVAHTDVRQTSVALCKGGGVTCRPNLLVRK